MTEYRELNLWCALHDSILRRVESSAFEHTAVIAVERPSLNEFSNYANGAQFELRFSAVESLEILVARLYYSETSEADATRRLESGAWCEFERSFDHRWLWDESREDAGRYEIGNAVLKYTEFGIEFIVERIVDYAGFTKTTDNLLCDMRIAAAAIVVVFPDGTERTIEQFNELGERFWKEVSERPAP